MYAFFVNFFVTILFNKSHIVRAVYYNIIYSVEKIFAAQILCVDTVFTSCILKGSFNYSLPHRTLQWEEISSNFCFNRTSLFQINRSVFMFVCIYSTFIFAFSTMENGHLKSLESRFRFVCSHFGSINSNCALRYL